MDTQITVAATEDGRVLLGFANELFSQAIYLPVVDISSMQSLGMSLFNALVTEAEKVIAKRDSEVKNTESPNETAD